MIVADVKPDGSYSVLQDAQEFPRLGRGVDSSFKIHPESVSLAHQALARYRTILDDIQPQSVYCVATSAMRVASNGNDVKSSLEATLGYPIDIISGKREAELTFFGTVGLTEQPECVIDIGGGSTEITVGSNGQVTDSISIEVGSVRFYEKFSVSREITSDALHEIEQVIQSQLGNAGDRLFKSCKQVIAVSGTPTALAMLQNGIEKFDAEAVNDTVLSFKSVEALSRTLLSEPQTLLSQFPGIDHSRAEILPAGCAILLKIMKLYDLHEVTVSTYGLRHGALLKAARIYT